MRCGHADQKATVAGAIHLKDEESPLSTLKARATSSMAGRRPRRPPIRIQFTGISKYDSPNHGTSTKSWAISDPSGPVLLGLWIRKDIGGSWTFPSDFNLSRTVPVP